jgi:hypothetical protein
MELGKWQGFKLVFAPKSIQNLISSPIFIFNVKEHHSNKKPQQPQVFSQLVLPTYEGVRSFEQVQNCEHLLKVLF